MGYRQVARTYEEMINLNVEVATTVFGFISGSYGLIAPNDVDGQIIEELHANTTGDAITLVFAEALPDGVTAVDLVFYDPATGNHVVELTTLDQITWTGTDADVTAILSAGGLVSLPVHVAYTDDGADAQLGLDIEPQCVRVGEEPAAPVAIPRNMLGVQGADYANGIATDYPDAGATNEVGGGCR